MAATYNLTKSFTSFSLSFSTRPLTCLPILSHHHYLPNLSGSGYNFSAPSIKLYTSTSIAQNNGSWKSGPIQIRAMSGSSDTQLEESVKKTIAENPVVVYSKSWCPYSIEVKSLFRRVGVEPLVIELDEMGTQGPQLQDVLESLTGQHTVPNVFIGGKHIGGCTDTVQLHQEGELEPLLSEANARKTES